MLLTVDELIEKFFGSSKKMSADKVYRLAKQNKIPSVKMDGRVFFPEEKFSAWINDQSQVDTTPIVVEHYGRDKQRGRLRVIRE